MRLFQALLLLCGSIYLTGCAQQLPPLNFSPPNVGFSETKHDADLRSITVTTGRTDELKGEIDMIMIESAGTAVSTGGGITTAWKESLTDAINRMAIFRDDGKKKVNLSVKILKIDVPNAGFSFETSAIAKYEILDRANGDIIYTSDISSTGTTPADFAFVGAIRARESVNRAIQNNITQFLQQLQTLDVMKPMFPTGRAVTPTS